MLLYYSDIDLEVNYFQSSFVVQSCYLKNSTGGNMMEIIKFFNQDLIITERLLFPEPRGQAKVIAVTLSIFG